VDIETRLDLISKKPTEEVITRNELKELLETNEHPTAYNGFEPSGRAHLGTGLVTALKMRDLTEAGVKYKVLLATWHAWLNNKFGGDREKIAKCAEYLKSVWINLGVPKNKLEFIDGEELAGRKEYWEKIMKVSNNVTLPRVSRTLTVLGRTEKEKLSFSMYMYTPMQVADIFELNVQICQLGMDQRKANMLAREVGPKLFGWKPVAVHHHLLMGLQGPKKMEGEFSGKMSKSKAETAIFVEDSPEQIKEKVKKAHCPPKQVEENPVIETAEYIIFRDQDSLLIERDKKYGGDMELTFEELKKDYKSGNLDPLDLKNAVARELIKKLEPCYKFFKKNPKLLEF
jgi:tyrosyl-tRNA synthetase